jgi:hypothetical protein
MAKRRQSEFAGVQHSIRHPALRKGRGIAPDGHGRDDHIILRREHLQGGAFGLEIGFRQGLADIALEKVAPRAPFTPLPIDPCREIGAQKQLPAREITRQGRANRSNDIPEGQGNGAIAPWMIADVAKSRTDRRDPLYARIMLTEGKTQPAERMA